MVICPLLGSHYNHTTLARQDVVVENVLHLLLVEAGIHLLLRLVKAHVPDDKRKEEERERVERNPVVGVALEALPEHVHLLGECRPLVDEEVLGSVVDEGRCVGHRVRGHVVVVRVHLEVRAVHLLLVNVPRLLDCLAIQFFCWVVRQKCWP